MKQTILMIEDNVDIMKINRSELTMHGYRVLEAETLEKGRDLLEQENPDLILLDILLPDGNGIAFCEELRKKSDVPILFLSALDENQHIVNGLMSGGDDYLPKPYDMDIMVARVEALLRRVRRKEEPMITKGALTLDTLSHHAFVKGKDIHLTQREYAVLLYLVQNEGMEISTEQLYETAWGQPMQDNPNAVKIIVSRLRKKIEPSGFKITVIRGVGYCFQ